LVWFLWVWVLHFFPSRIVNFSWGLWKKGFWGVASAALVTFRVLGQLIGMALIVLLVNVYLVGGSVAGGSFRALMMVSFVLFILLLVVGLVLTLKAK